MKKIDKFAELVELMKTLRGENGCVWDKSQTHESLIKYLREESEEAIEAIEAGNLKNELQEELGDVLLQVIFHAQIAGEEGRFDVYDVIDSLIQKLKFRHPHVFGGEKAETPNDVKKIWQTQKMKEKKRNDF